MATVVNQAVVQPVDQNEFSADDPAGFGRIPETEFERAVVRARREYLARGGRFLSAEEISREVAEMRGERNGSEVE